MRLRSCVPTMAHTHVHTQAHTERSTVRGCHKWKELEEVWLMFCRSCHKVKSLKGGVIQTQRTRKKKEHTHIHTKFKKQKRLNCWIPWACAARRDEAERKPLRRVSCTARREGNAYLLERASLCDFGCPEHALRSSTGTQACVVCTEKSDDCYSSSGLHTPRTGARDLDHVFFTRGL